MDIKFAAQKTRELILSSDDANWPSDGPLSLLHVKNMLVKIECSEIAGEKAHRWLGWAQAAAVSANVGTLDIMKSINYTSS